MSLRSPTSALLERQGLKAQNSPSQTAACICAKRGEYPTHNVPPKVSGRNLRAGDAAKELGHREAKILWFKKKLCMFRGLSQSPVSKALAELPWRDCSNHAIRWHTYVAREVLVLIPRTETSGLPSVGYVLDKEWEIARFFGTHACAYTRASLGLAHPSVPQLQFGLAVKVWCT